MDELTIFLMAVSAAYVLCGLTVPYLYVCGCRTIEGTKTNFKDLEWPAPDCWMNMDVFFIFIWLFWPVFLPFVIVELSVKLIQKGVYAL